MRIGVLVLMAGRAAGGPETYEVEMLRSLARIDRRNEYVVYCTGAEAPRAIGVQQENVRYHILKPSSRAVSVSVTLPMRLVPGGIDLLHPTVTPPPLAGRVRCPCLTVFSLGSEAHHMAGLFIKKDLDKLIADANDPLAGEGSHAAHAGGQLKRTL